MAKTTSKDNKKQKTSGKARVKSERLQEKQDRKARRAAEKSRRLAARAERQKTSFRPHKSFHRTYHEDYDRSLNLPGLMHHAAATFALLFKHWRLFLPLVLLSTVLSILLIGLLSEETYVQFQDAIDQTANGELNNAARASLLLISTITTGGLTNGMSEVQQVFVILLFIVAWLVTIYLLRHLLAGQHPKLRDGLYNALTPLIPSVMLAVVLLVDLVPIALVVIIYSHAASTNFLSTPFYAFAFFIFALLLIILSLYLAARTFIALIAVSAPGVYPLDALRASSDLVMSRRIRILLRVFYLVPVLAIIWAVIMLPLIALDLQLKANVSWLAGTPVIPFIMVFMTCCTVVYFSAYSYLFYRRLLDYDE